MFSSSVRAAMKSTIGASHSAAFCTRSVLLRKRGSAITSSRPIARKRRSAIAWHALAQGAKAGPVAIGAILPPARDADDDEAGVACVQDLRPEPHFFERPWAEILDQDLARRRQIEQ